MIRFSTLISIEELYIYLDQPDWVVIDCRFSLNDPAYGRREYLKGHIPGSVYAHLDEDLCSPIIPGRTGRHPLPEISMIERKLSKWGIDQSVQVVAYDVAGGAMAAARLWWLLQWLGHPNVAVLDGCWQAWTQAGYPIRAGEELRNPRTFHPQPRPEMLVSTDFVEHLIKNKSDYILLDSRTRERYLGEFEPIDPVAGHIPGAICAPYTENIGDHGRFLPKDALQERFKSLIGNVPSDKVIFYCGSGVTAAQNILAMAHAGLGLARLYAGSWSEWITDPHRPVAKG